MLRPILLFELYPAPSFHRLYLKLIPAFIVLVAVVFILVIVVVEVVVEVSVFLAGMVVLVSARGFSSRVLSRVGCVVAVVD